MLTRKITDNTGKLFKSLNGLRLGQAIYNSLSENHYDIYQSSDTTVGNKLFYIEDKKLIKAIKEELKKESI